MLIELHPELQNVYTCPVCERRLVLHGFAVTGVRNVVEGTCLDCKREFFVDAPTDQAIYTPITVDKRTREVFDPTDSVWFSRMLVNSLRDRVTPPPPMEKRCFREVDELILINCLDYCYGHSLEKLSNVLFYLDHCAHLGIWVLVPKQLAHLVPPGVAEVWEVDLPWRQFMRWHTQLEVHVRQHMQSKRRTYLGVTYPQPNPRSYDLVRLLGPEPAAPVVVGSPVVVVAYREDRTWGGTVRRQRRRLVRLYEALSAVYPNFAFVLAGFGRKAHFGDGLLDRRTDTFDPDLEREWIALCRQADCVIGVHGSNMHIPSRLARNTIELLPVDRLPNVLQDLQVSADEAPLDVLFHYRLLYGNQSLDDIAPEVVAATVRSQIDLGPSFHLRNDLDMQPRHAAKESEGELRAWLGELRDKRIRLGRGH